MQLLVRALLPAGKRVTKEGRDSQCVGEIVVMGEVAHGFCGYRRNTVRSWTKFCLVSGTNAVSPLAFDRRVPSSSPGGCTKNFRPVIRRGRAFFSDSQHGLLL